MQALEKPALRSRYLAARREFIDQKGSAPGRRLDANLNRLLRDLALTDVAVYAARADEAPLPLKNSYFYPRVEAANLAFYRPKNTRQMLPSKLGIREPNPKKSVALDLSRRVVVCCPAVALDWTGARLGFGQGYYDRLFQTHPQMIRVGVAYQVQVTKDPLPADRWDQPLDWIVTEEMILRTTIGELINGRDRAR